MRIAAAALAALFCTLIGYMKAERAEERQKTIDCFLNDIRQISMQIEFTSDPICIILDKICLSSGIAEIWRKLLGYINEGMCCSEAWMAVSENEAGILNMLEKEERAGLDSFFGELGKTDKTAETKNAEYAYKLLESISERLKTTSENNKKMYRSVGTLIGIAAAILII